jgi:hypothetical protein
MTRTPGTSMRDFKKIHLIRSAFHGHWNYRIDPNTAAARPAPAAAAAAA